MKMKKNFYDTSSLLLLGSSVFNQETEFIISSVTLAELENIKNARNKDEELKAQARQLLQCFKENENQFITFIHRKTYELEINNYDLEINNDTKILADAITYNNTIEQINFVTNDMCLRQFSLLFFPFDCVKMVTEEEDNYKGYKEVKLTDKQMAKVYENLTFNHFNSLTNEYVILKNYENQVVDILCWNGTEYRNIKYKTIESKLLGTTKPWNNDPYQRIAFDILNNNQLVMFRGKAGTAKSYLSIAYLFQQLEQGKIDKIVMFFNPVATADAAKLGFYSGSRIEKLLDSQPGNFLSSKLGGMDVVQQLIDRERLVLLPFSDIRGMDTSGTKAGIYITEAQNLNANLLKLALQRVGEDCICIIEGDDKTQLDLDVYAGQKNGMKKMSKVFRGQPYYAEVELQNCYRSKIAAKAEEMK